MRNPVERAVVDDDVANETAAESCREGHHEDAYRIDLLAVGSQNARKGKRQNADEVGQSEKIDFHGWARTVECAGL